MLLEKIAEYAIRERSSKLPAEVIHHAKRAVIDWYAALLPGSRRARRRSCSSRRSPKNSTAAARGSRPGRRATLRAAALINGAASHTVEVDDIFRDAVYHPGAPMISAALAQRRRSGASGEQFLRGVIVGYEISTRIGEAVMPSHYKYWHTTGTVGCVRRRGRRRDRARLRPRAVRARARHRRHVRRRPAAGVPLGSDDQAAARGPRRRGRRDWRRWRAAKGVTGALDILEGEVGFGAAMSVKPDWDKATRGLGNDYNIAHMTFKNHGCCGHTFARSTAVIESAEQAQACAEGYRRHPHRDLQGRHRHRRQLQRPRATTRRSSACSTWWRTR